MNRVQEVINKYTQGLALMERVYSEQLPTPQKISKELGELGVSELFNEIAEVSAERERLDHEGEVNCDVLDDYWRTTSRLASLIPYQLRLYPKAALEGLSNKSESVRFYTAYSLEKVPFRSALPHLQRALKTEPEGLNIRVLNCAIQACSSWEQCTKETINKLIKKAVPWE